MTISAPALCESGREGVARVSHAGEPHYAVNNRIGQTVMWFSDYRMAVDYAGKHGMSVQHIDTFDHEHEPTWQVIVNGVVEWTGRARAQAQLRMARFQVTGADVEIVRV